MPKPYIDGEDLSGASTTSSDDLSSRSCSGSSKESTGYAGTSSDDESPLSLAEFDTQALRFIEEINLLKERNKLTQREAINKFSEFISENLHHLDFQNLSRYLNLLDIQLRNIFLLIPQKDLLKKIFTCKNNICEFLTLFEPLPATIFLFNLNAIKLARIGVKVDDLLELEHIKTIIPPARKEELMLHFGGTRSSNIILLMYKLYFLPDEASITSADHEGFDVLQDNKLNLLHNEDIWQYISTPLELEIITLVLRAQDRLAALQLIFARCPEHLKTDFQNFTVLSRLAELIPADQRDELLNILITKMDKKSADTLRVTLLAVSHELQTVGATTALLMAALRTHMQPFAEQAKPIAEKAIHYAWDHRADIASRVGELLFSIQYPYLYLMKGAVKGCLSFWRSEIASSTTASTMATRVLTSVTSREESRRITAPYLKY